MRIVPYQSQPAEQPLFQKIVDKDGEAVFVALKDGFKRLAQQRVKTELLGWDLVLEDEHGRRRTAFMRGPTTEHELFAAAATTFRNWSLKEFKRAKTPYPSDSARAVPVSAHRLGVLESLSSLRLR